MLPSGDSVIQPTDRVHISRQALMGLTLKEERQYDGFKPEGFWYGFGLSWVKWCESEQPNWIHKRWYRIEVNPEKILVLMPSDLDDFTKQYGKIVHPNHLIKDTKYLFIDWPRVAETYHGIEIPEYSPAHRFSLMWYYGWDCASGCIWHPLALTGIQWTRAVIHARVAVAGCQGKAKP